RLEVARNGRGPVLALALRDLRVAEARQIDEAALRVQLEDHELLRPPRRAARAGEAAPLAQRVDEARLADVRATGKRDLRTPIGRQLRERVGGDREACLPEQPLGGEVRGRLR